MNKTGVGNERMWSYRTSEINDIEKENDIHTGVDTTDLNDIEEFELPTLGRDISLTGVGEM